MTRCVNCRSGESLFSHLITISSPQKEVIIIILEAFASLHSTSVNFLLQNQVNTEYKSDRLEEQPNDDIYWTFCRDDATFQPCNLWTRELDSEARYLGHSRTQHSTKAHVYALLYHGENLWSPAIGAALVGSK